MKPLSLLLSLLFTTQLFSQSKYAKTSVYFETDKFILEDAYKIQIDSFIAGFDDRIINKVILKGNTDSDADSLYNIQLSKNRAESVKTYLATKNIDKNSIDYRYYGENKPIAANATDPGKQQNRRVDIIIVWSPIPVAEEKQEEVIVEEIIKEKCVEGDTMIAMEGGAIVVMDRCEYLEKKDCLKFNEVVSFNQVLESGMTTMDDEGNTMITGGMFSMSMKKDCDECPEVKVLVPEVFCPFSQLMIWDIGPNGRWTNPAPANSVRINDRNYVEMELSCSGGGMRNADCKMPDTCPCWKDKAPLAGIQKFEIASYGEFELTEVRIAFNDPISVTSVANAIGKKQFLLDAMPHTGDPIVNATGRNSNGIMIMINKPLSELQHVATPSGNNIFSKYYITESDFDIISTNEINYRF